MSFKKTRGKSRHISVLLLVLLFALIVILIWNYCDRNSTSTDADNGLRTINAGTQANFDDLGIGLGSIQDDSASISIHSKSASESTNKTVVQGDKFEIYGYTIEVKSVKRTANISQLIGSSHGYIKLLVNKQ